jgi:hypothetical protein
MVFFKVILAFPWRDEDKQTKILVKVTESLAGYFLNTSVQTYCCTRFLGKVLLKII